VTEFTWRDGERVVRFGPAAPPDSPYLLLTTPRAALPEFTEAAAGVVHVPAGRVDEISAELLASHSFASDVLLLALGGGRVVDTAKALAGATGGRCGAVPTTLSGAEMTGFHRTPAGVDGAALVRPVLVLADPELMASAPVETLAASSMNALAHAMEALYTPLANPVASLAALRSATLLSEGITADPPDRESLALGALLAGYASGSTGIAVHHALCQMLVRLAATPHAETNAVMLPHSARMMEGRAPDALGTFRAALARDLAALTALTGRTRLSDLGVSEQQLPEVVEAVAAHPYLANTPDPPGPDELLAVLRGAL
jgi:alcohol dehydrogenase class IV